jgi:hypothetical protein
MMAHILVMECRLVALLRHGAMSDWSPLCDSKADIDQTPDDRATI